MASTTLRLDICTPEGKTWCAQITGLGGKYGVQRDFIHAASTDTSRSGRTSTATYELEDGAYETNEGRRHLGRRYWIIKDGVRVEVDSAKAAFEGDATKVVLR